MNGIPRESLQCKNIVSNDIGPFPEDFYLVSKKECNGQWSFEEERRTLNVNNSYCDAGLKS